MAAPLHLAEADVQRLFTPAVALASARRAFAALGRGQVVMPSRIATPIASHDAIHLSMPCYLADAEGEVLAMKAVTLYPRNRARGLDSVLGFVALYDASTGAPVAFMEAATLTARRTAAGCALATKVLARPDSSKLAVFGAGRQAAAHIEAIAAQFELSRIRLYGPDSTATTAFCRRIGGELGIEIDPASTPDGCLEGADIVCTTTNSSMPVFEAADLPAGAHLNAIGSHQPATAEFDPTLVPRARVFVDELEAARTGAGELIQAAESGIWSWDLLAGTLADLELERRPGRGSRDQLTVFKSVGLAVQDATAASSVFQRFMSEHPRT